jgi:hypothetical protein
MSTTFAAENVEHILFLLQKTDGALAKDVAVDLQADLDRQSIEEGGLCLCLHLRVVGWILPSRSWKSLPPEKSWNAKVHQAEWMIVILIIAVVLYYCCGG